MSSWPIVRGGPVVSAIGAAVVLGVLSLAFANGFGLDVNVSVTAIGLALLIAVWVQPARLATMPVATSDFAIVAFVAASVLSLLIHWRHSAWVPVPYLLHTAALLVLCPVSYVLGRVFAHLAEPAAVRRIFLIALTMSCAFAFVRMLVPDIVVSDQGEKGSYYQYAGDSLALVALIAYALDDKRRLRISIWVTVAVLLVLGSRASLAAFVCALLFSVHRWTVAGSAAVFLLAVGMNIGGIGDLAPMLEQLSRVGATIQGLLSGGLVDTSLSDRQAYLELAIATLEHSPVLGSYAYDYLGNGEAGGFAHNAIDLWAQFGVLAFLLFSVSVLATPSIALLRNRPCLDAGPVVRFVPLYVFVVVQLAFFRHPESVVIFFGVGSLVSLSLYRSTAGFRSVPDPSLNARQV